ncbi:MAG: branched-chain amino acid transport system II carrier protein [Peptococcaceae bacterium]|nr:branched-chain amino acid transport system II carrier protein [Peptococcaceae bacterium]
MKDRLSLKKLLSLSMMLFALFFGAGNMIFPPAMGQAAGTNVWIALAGFIFTDVGLPVLCIAAVVFANRSLNNALSGPGVGFAFFFVVLLHLLIGPLFAIPRTGSVSFEMAIVPFIGDGSLLLFSFIYTAIFFGATWFLSSNPSKIVSIVGDILTPVLLISIFIIGITAVINPISPMGAPIGDYNTIAFSKGMIEGYNAMDALAAGIFALIVIENVETMGVKRESGIIKYTMLAGVLAAVGLAVVYGILAYVGATVGALGEFSNGGALLSTVANHMFGTVGQLILGIAVMFACLTTSIGLTTACGDYFSKHFESLSYKKVTTAVCLFSFFVSNIGLTQLLNITVPGLLMVYPVLMALIITSFFRKWLNRGAYIGIVAGSALVSIPEGLAALFGTYLPAAAGPIKAFLAMIPFQSLGIGWVVPAAILGVIGYIIGIVKK